MEKDNKDNDDRDVIFKQITYHNNRLIALDDEGRIWHGHKTAGHKWKWFKVNSPTITSENTKESE